MAADDAYTKLLLHMDGINNGTVFTDETGKVVTRIGNTCTTINQKKFGDTSAFFDGNGDGLDIPTSADFMFGTGDFTVDFWLYRTANANQLLLSSTDNGGLFICIRNTGYISIGRTNVADDASVASGIALNTWAHVAIARYGTALRIFVDGVQKGATFTNSQSYNITSLVRIGYYGTWAWYFAGYLDEFRVSKGIARWVANFTPPITAYVGRTYRTAGTALLTPTIIPDLNSNPITSILSWQADIPEGTAVGIKVAIAETEPSEEAYTVATNGGEIPGLDSLSAGKMLYIKAYLSTTDIAKTPRFKSLAYVIAQDVKSSLQILLTDTGRLKYPIEDVTVEYNKTLGNLTGLQGGQVQSFSSVFTPSLTTRIFNPNDAEKINAALSVVSSKMRIYYEYYRSDNTHIQANLGALTQIIAVADIPV